MSLATVLVSYVFTSGSIHVPFIKTMIDREKAKQLALGGIQIAISQLSQEVDASQDAKNEQAKPDQPDQSKKPKLSPTASSEALAKGEASGKEEVVAAPASAATNPAQAAPAPQAAIPSTTTAPQIEKKSPKGTGGSPRNVKAPMKTIKHEIDIPQSQHQKQLLLDIQVMCTNIPGVPLRKKQIEDSIKGGKVYGSSFDLKGHKQCYIVAKKYKDDAPAPEIQECIEKIYGGVLGVGGALEL